MSRIELAPGLVGWSLNWSPDDLVEVTAFHRALPEPDLSPEERGRQIAALVDEQGYSLTDIGAMLGITKERVRQIARQYGARSSGAAYRRWSDRAGQFVFATEDEVANHIRSAVGRRTAAEYLEHRRQKVYGRMLEDVEAVQAVASRIERAPTPPEVAAASGTRLAVWYSSVGIRWGYGRGATYRQAINRLWCAAGFDQVPDGRSRRQR